MQIFEIRLLLNAPKKREIEFFLEFLIVCAVVKLSWDALKFKFETQVPKKSQSRDRDVGRISVY